MLHSWHTGHSPFSPRDPSFSIESNLGGSVPTDPHTLCARESLVGNGTRLTRVLAHLVDGHTPERGLFFVSMMLRDTSPRVVVLQGPHLQFFTKESLDRIDRC